MDTGDLTDTQRDSLTRLSQHHAGNTAVTCAEMAGRRAAELQRRRKDLSAGFGATAETVVVAQRRAAESLRRATGSPSGRGSGRALGALMSSRGPLPH
jgi:two-component system, chemotaxis family, protein-glutamate methylesterase/glutaminase